MCGAFFFAGASATVLLVVTAALQVARFDTVCKLGFFVVLSPFPTPIAIFSLLSLTAFVALFATLFLFATPTATSSLLSLIAFIVTAFLAGGLGLLSAAFEACN